jgi:hypothetical protein
MQQKNTKYIDLMSQIHFDTFLSIKYSNGDKTVWCKYYIPTTRKNGTPVLYGQLYSYFIAKKGFLFALGYVAQDDPDGKHHTAKYQYFGFTANEPPHEQSKMLQYELILPKHFAKR